MLKRIFLLIGIGISAVLVWFAIANYRASRPIVEESLRGLALSLASAIESIISDDPSLKSLAEFHPPDCAFFAVIDRDGVYLSHSNTDLIGTKTRDDDFRDAIESKEIVEKKVLLGTGEIVYEYYLPHNLTGQLNVIQLALHTYRADAVTRRAEYNTAVLLALLTVGWILGLILYRFAVRDELRQMEMARREKLARLGEMGAMLAHEIRNPLAGIKGYAQIIEKRPEEARNAGFAHRIVAEVLRLENLVSDLLVYSGSGSYPLTPVNLREIIAYAMSYVRHEAGQQGVTLEYGEGPEVFVVGNRDKLAQVFLNLFKNGLQAMPEGGTLRVTTPQTGRNVTVTTTDTGSGITPDHMKRIFEPFFTTKARGTGLGLALCKKIVEEHGGKIALESTDGGGTTVSVTLPVTENKD